MTTFKNKVNAFGDSAGDSLAENCTNWGGKVGMPKGKLKRYPSAVADISGSNRRMAKAKHGEGGSSGVSMKGVNAFSKRK